MAAAGLLAGCHPGSRNDASSSGQHERDEKVQTAYYKYLQGNLGGKKVTLQLTKSDGQYDGIFYEDSLARPVTISGSTDTAGHITLVTYRQYDPVDTLQGTFSQPGVFSGYCKPAEQEGKGSQAAPAAFALQEIYSEGTRRWQVYRLQDSLSLKPGDSSSPKARIAYTLLWPGKGWPDAGHLLVQQTLAGDLLGLHTPVTAGAQALRNAADSFLTTYKQARANLSPGFAAGTFNWESQIRMELLWNAGDIVSLACNRYEYTGGAHGQTNTLLVVWDLKHARILERGDLFRPGYEKKLQQVLEQKLRRAYDIPEKAALNSRRYGILFDKHLNLTDNFYLTGHGIGFIYNPYEVAPYAVGPIELFVPFSELQDVLKNPGGVPAT
ncbi:hypothetical protein GCM10023143_29880 [Compostibacter hankyongensis]|uniref:DUF3298 domain-containing protein n=2 Tax=Compostibacter hankyongensis TaxID=1007089 RepID=A0ABP8G5Y0_9BACT